MSDRRDTDMIAGTFEESHYSVRRIVGEGDMHWLWAAWGHEGRGLALV